MKKIFLLIALSIFSTDIFSQQDPQFAHNSHNLLFTNPAYAGMTDGICASAISRQQWVGFEGAPITTLAGIHTKVKLFGITSGVGLTIMDDRYEFEKNFQAKLAYSYHKRISSGVLGIGADLGFINKDLKGEWKYPDPDGSSDPFIFINEGGTKAAFLFDMGIGAYYKIGEKFYAGFSVSHILQPNINYFNINSASFLRRHYFATAGYNFRLLNSPVEMQPSVFVKFDGTKMQYSGNISALYNKKIRIGVTYRNLESFIPMIGIDLIGGLKIGYAYEIPITKLITVSKGSHEVFVGYCFDFWGTNNNYKYKSILYL
jgi:type IX secretion system PorP/SprF family membrane protein